MLQTGQRRTAQAVPEAGQPETFPPGQGRRRNWSDWSVSSVTAGFLAVLVSFTGPLAIFYQAAQAGNADSATFASWVWGISIGAAVSGIVLSWMLRAPIITAWSAPGTALLITLFPGLSLNEAVGAYLTAAAILLVVGLSGSFDRLMACVPKGVASGMMAGILLPFGLNAFRATATLPLLACGMILAYLVFRRWAARYSVMLLLVAGVLLALAQGATHFSNVELQLVAPQFIMPAWSWASTFSLALPLVLVTLAGQYLPGMASSRPRATTPRCARSWASTAWSRWRWR